MRGLIVAAAFGVLATLGFAPDARAQNACQSVSVEAVQQRRIELFDTQGTLVTTVTRDELGPVTAALECPSMPSYLGIRVQGQRWLVRRAALRLRTTALELPVCAAGQYASQAARNASSSGIGGANCRQPD